MKYMFACDRKPRARKSYADRTGMSSRASVTLAAAVVTKPESFEDDNGNTIRVWKSSEMSSYSNADIASCLVNRVAVEPNEMLGTVPPSAIKYAVTKGWLLPNGDKTLYRVTLKGHRARPSAAVQRQVQRPENPVRCYASGRECREVICVLHKTSMSSASHHKTQRLIEFMPPVTGLRALSLANTFRYLGPHRDTIRLAHECRVHPRFYRSLGRDPEAATAAASRRC